MNKYAFFTVTAIIVISTGIWIADILSFNKSTTIYPELISVKEKLFDLHKSSLFAQLSKDEKRDEILKVINNIPETHKHIKHQYQVAMSNLPEIDFHGRVIDQYGNPVKNGIIVYIGANAYLSAGGGMGFVETDTNGFFVIDTTGASLQLRGVKHPDIDGVLFSNGAIAAQFYANDHHGDIYNYNKYSKKENAYIIQAWRFGLYENAKKGNIRGHYDRVGQLYTLDLTKNTYTDIIQKGKRNGQLRISCTRQLMENPKDFGSWSTTIEAINGGLQETDDLYMNVAPMSGYASSVNINMMKSNSEYAHELLDKSYYFKSNNGKEYGVLQVDFVPHSKYWDDKACIVDIKYKINSTGSRNLELKKAPIKHVQPANKRGQSEAPRVS